MAWRSASGGRSLGILRRALVLITGAVLVGGVVALDAAGVLRDAERRSLDTRFSLRGAEPAPEDVLVVAIDERTLQRHRFPLSRRVHAQAIDRLRRADASVIAYDVQFSEPSGDAGADAALVHAIDRAPAIVLAGTETAPGGRTNILGGDAFRRSLGAHAGMALLPNDANGVVRRVRYAVDDVQAFGIVAAELAAGRHIGREGFGGDGTALIDFAGPPGTIDRVSLLDLVEGRVPAAAIAGRVAVVGATAANLQDVHPTAFGAQDLMPGAEIQANVVATALRGFPLRPVAPVIGLLLLLGLGAVGPLAGVRLGPVRGALVAAAAALAYAVAAQLAFGAGRVIPVVGPLLALAAGTVGALWSGLAVNAFERARLRDLFGRFVGAEVVGEVLDRVDADLRLGGERRVVTVMFSDLRGFTAFCERQPPDVVIEVLNRYLTTMSDVILDAGGTLITYLGDGIMAVFGAPVEHADHADRALQAARRMTGEALEEFNAWLTGERGEPGGFAMGVGLNTGPVMVGNVGSERRLEYAAVGDVTNTAARLEGLTRETGHAVLLSDATRATLTRPVADLEPVAEVPVRGRRALVSLWTVRGAAAPEPQASAAAP